MARGRPKLIKEFEDESLDPNKFNRTYEDEHTITTWKYDLTKSTSGPVEVDIKYKNGYDKPRNWNNLAKQAKNERKLDRQKRKLNNK
jgi:hypothetical protein